MAMTVGAFVLAGSHVCAKGALLRIGLSALLFWRAVAALLVSLPMLPWMSIGELGLSGVAWVAIAVFLSPILLNALFFVGLRAGQVGVQNALRQNSPVAVIALQALLFMTAPTAGQWGGLAVLVLGTSWLARLQGRAGLLSVVFGLLAAFAHGGSIVAQAYALRHINQAALIVIQNAAFVAAVLLMVLLRPSSRWSVRASVTEPSHRAGVLLAAASGIGINLIFDLLKILALPHLGVTVVACLVLLNLPVSVWMGRVFFRERVGGRSLSAILVVLLGALLLILTSR